MGKSLRMLGSLMLALGLLQAVQAAQPLATPESLMQQAVAASEAGRLDQAQALLERALVQAPDSSLVHTRLGGIQLLQQDYSAGIGTFQRAIMLDDANADAFIGLAIAYLHQGRYALAREALKEATRLGPAKRQEIEQVLTWLDQRDPATVH